MLSRATVSSEDTQHDGLSITEHDQFSSASIARHKQPGFHQDTIHRPDIIYNPVSSVSESRTSTEQVLQSRLSVINEEVPLMETDQASNFKSPRSTSHPSGVMSLSHSFPLSNRTDRSSLSPSSSSFLEIQQQHSSIPNSSCIASTGESSYELSSVDSGVSLHHHLASVGSTSINETSTEAIRQEAMKQSQISSPTDDKAALTNGSSSIIQQKMQSKIDALTLSNELLKTSLDDARRQITSLQATIVNQREEITAKEAQINTINGRVTALLRGMESTDSNNMQYKELYHKSVQQNGILQAQLSKYSRMSSQMENFLGMQERALNQLDSNKRLINFWREDMKQRERACLGKVKEVSLLNHAHKEMIKECQELRESNKRIHFSNQTMSTELAKCVVQKSISAAKFNVLVEEAIAIKESLEKRNHELQGKLAHLLDSYNHAKDEFQENSEFSAMEREMLLEANTELEQEVTSLKKELQDGETEFKKLVDYIKEYQAESVKKSGTLKANLAKADKEIEELDKLVERVRQVLSENLFHVKKSKNLTNLLRLLNGEEQL